MGKTTKVNPGHNGAGNGNGHVQHGNGNGYGHDKHPVPPPPPPPNYEDGKITLIGANGQEIGKFATFAAALAAAQNGDTLQVGAGVFKEVFTLEKDVTIIGEKGAILDGSGFSASIATAATIELGGGADGSTISGLQIVAIQGGNAVTNEFGVEVNNVVLTNNTFSAGANISGAVVYFNPGASNIDIIGNEFQGEFLVNSPLLGLDVSNGFGPTDADIDVTGNNFGPTPASTYAEVEIFNDSGGEVTLTSNTGLVTLDVSYGMY